MIFLNQKELNSKIVELIKTGKDEGEVRKLISSIKEVKGLEEDYDFLYSVILMSKNVSNETLIRKLKNFSKISSNPEIVKKQFLSSLNLYMATLGEPETVVVVGKTDIRTFKSKKDKDKEYKRATITLYFPETKYMNIFNIYDENQWTSLEPLDLGQTYRLNMITRNGEKYISKDPNPEEVENAKPLDNEELKLAIEDNFEELDLANLGKEELKGVYYLYGVALNVESTGKSTTIIPSSVSELEDELPEAVLSIVVMDETNVEAGDLFLAIGSPFKALNGKGYTMFPNMFVTLSEHEPEEEEADETYNMNDTGSKAEEKEVASTDDDDEDEEEEDEDADKQ